MSSRIKNIRRLAEILLNSRYLMIFSTVLFFIVVGTAFLLVYENAGIMRDQINHDFNHQQLILARQAAFQVGADLQDVEIEFNSLQRLFVHRPGKDVFEDAVKEAAKRMRSKGLIELGLADRRRQVRLSYALTGGDRSDSLPKSLQCGCGKESHLLLGPLQKMTEADGSTGFISLLCTCLDSDDQQSGILFARLNVSRLFRRVTRTIRSGQSGYAWVINGDGIFLYHPDRELIGRNAFSVNQQDRPYIFLRKSTEALREQMLGGQEGTGGYESARHVGPVGRISKLIAFTPIESEALDGDRIWSVAVTAPTDEIAEAVHRVYTRHFAAEVALIASMFVFGWLAFIYQQRVSRGLQERVSEQQEIIASIMKNSVDGIIFIDLQNRVKLWNRGAELIYGYTSEEMVGQTFHRLIPPDIDANRELRRIAEEVTRYGHIRNYRARRLTKDGRRITVDISRTLIFSKDNQILGSTAIIKDITEEVEMDQRIYNAEKLASIGTLAAGVAHEINNPLGIILGFTDLLRERFEPGSQEYKDLQLIEQNAQNAKQIVEDMLGFARVTEGFEEVVNVPKSIGTVVKVVHSTLKTENIEIAVDCPDLLPRVRGDTREYQQVIFNLINNAVAAMEPGGGILTIAAAENNGQVAVTIADTGNGIPDRIKTQIFDPFFTTKKAGEGTGLGLSLCYGIVKKYGGSITFDSISEEDHPGRKTGTTFTVSMPVCSASELAEGEKA
ncbi:MAG: PAS domain S-box protein [Candidatus Zixiibacteriota bacterium]|nr:MAG: PAS domain S-box protein [candidate division Zixibacteria bacterium]